jgi:hypothetical protein
MRAYILQAREVTERHHLINVYRIHILYFLFIFPESIMFITQLNYVNNTGGNMCTHASTYLVLASCIVFHLLHSCPAMYLVLKSDIVAKLSMFYYSIQTHENV